MRRIAAAITIMGLTAGCALPDARPDRATSPTFTHPAPLEPEPVPTIEAGAMIVQLPTCRLEVHELETGIWMHTTWRDFGGNALQSNGLIVFSGEQMLLVDTAWSDAETDALLNLIHRRWFRLPDAAVITHFHEDRAGGVGALQRRGVPVYATARTQNRLPGASELVFQTLGTPVDAASLASFGIEIFYPGAGHTSDNILVWHYQSGLLFGGCLIRPADAADLGNTADADLDHWGKAARAVLERYGAAQTVVVAHGPAAGVDAIHRTIELSELATK